MLNDALARRYAEALFNLVENTTLESTEADLRQIIALTQEHEDVAHILNHPHISLREKKNLMDKLIGEEISLTTKNFLFLLIDRRRQAILPLVQKAFSLLADKARQTVEAKVASASALSSEQEQKLEEALVRVTGKKVRLISEQRPELIGGIRVQVGDRVWDGTIVHALDRMREDLRKSAGYRG